MQKYFRHSRKYFRGRSVKCDVPHAVGWDLARYRRKIRLPVGRGQVIYRARRAELCTHRRGDSSSVRTDGCDKLLYDRRTALDICRAYPAAAGVQSAAELFAETALELQCCVCGTQMAAILEQRFAALAVLR